MKNFSIAIHGGAGTILKTNMTQELEFAYHSGIRKSLEVGASVLRQGGTSIQGVEAAVVELENNPLFNAGKGAVFTHNGKNEMDASIMDGSNLKAGAIAGVRNVKNPIILARSIMEKSEHVFMLGQGAELFAKSLNLDFETDEYFYTQQRYDQLQDAIRQGRVQLDHTDNQKSQKKFGTVGAVAIDSFGNLASATSTGGMTNKQFGRVGDSSIIGAGTYANNNTCAISCTGHGEFFIRGVVAYDVSCLMEYKHLSLVEACRFVVHDKLIKLGGEGGLVAIDKAGNIELCFNSEGMYRGRLNSEGDFFVGIYK